VERWAISGKSHLLLLASWFSLNIHALMSDFHLINEALKPKNIIFFNSLFFAFFITYCYFSIFLNF